MQINSILIKNIESFLETKKCTLLTKMKQKDLKKCGIDDRAKIFTNFNLI